MSLWSPINGKIHALIFTASRYVQRFRLSSEVRHRQQQYSTVTSSQIDDVKVKIGSGGHIVLNIHHPFTNPTSTRIPTPIVLFLPRGPIPSGQPLEPEDDLLSSLLTNTGSTVVRINYRLSADGQHKFPKPIHDVLAGYDWVSKHLIRGAVLGNGWQRDEGSKKIVVFGELIGGGLATMLSLTENHIGRIGIEAAAVVNPVVDWTFPDTVSSQELRQDEEEAEIDNNTIGKKRRSSKSKILGSWTAFGEQGPVNANCWLSLRKKCFSKPEYYFDPFASPLLFFRTPGLEVPSEDPPCAKSELSGSGSGEETSIIRRKAHRRFPPTGSGLRLPNMLISVGEDNLLRDQGVELAELMRRSLVMHERLLRRNEISDPWFYNRAQVNEGTRGLNEEAEQRVQLLKKPGTGLLGLKSPTERRKEMADIGNWLCDVLR